MTASAAASAAETRENHMVDKFIEEKRLSRRSFCPVCMRDSSGGARRDANAAPTNDCRRQSHQFAHVAPSPAIFMADDHSQFDRSSRLDRRLRCCENSRRAPTRISRTRERDSQRTSPSAELA
jgi:hypothetical protein